MKHSVVRFKSLELCLNEMKKFIRNGELLETGKPLKKFGGLRPREIWANWLLCVVANYQIKSERFKICTDPLGGDGIIYDTAENMAYPTEHILVSQRNSEQKDIGTLTLEHIDKKQRKGGAAYASGKTLIVFLNKSAGNWYPNRVAGNLNQSIDFDSIWVIGLQNTVEGKYLYNITRIFPVGRPVWCPIWQVSINKNFDGWSVKQIQ